MIPELYIYILYFVLKTVSIAVPYSDIFCMSSARSQSNEERKTGEIINVETTSALDSEPSNILGGSSDNCPTTTR